ncbi:TPA: oligosaccharide flippase family protein [Vibrio cholerae]
MKIRGLLLNIMYMGLVQFFNYAAPLLVIPFLTRVFSVEEFGVFSIYMSIAALCFVLTDLGFTLSCTNLIALSKDNQLKVNKIVSSAIIAKFIVLFILILMSSIFWKLGFIRSGYDWIVLIFTVFTQSLFLNWYFQGKEKMQWITVTYAISKVLYLSLVFLFIKDSSTASDVLFLLGVSNIFALCTSWCLAYKNGLRLVKVDLLSVWELLGVSKGFWLSRLSVSIYTSANVATVSFFSNPWQAAIYSVSEKVYQGVQNITSPISQAMYPYLSRTRDLNIFFIVTLATAIPIIACASLIMINAEWIVIFLFGEKYIETESVLIFLMISSIVTYISVSFGYPAYSIFNRLDFVNVTTYVGTFLYFLFLVHFFVFDFEINALLMSKIVLLTELLVMLIRLVMFFYLYLNKESYNNEKYN